MNKEQKTLKSCYILDRLREWFELYGNQNRQRAEEELHLAIDELYEYQQKDQQIADLETKLAEKDEQIKRRIAVYEKQFIEQTNENCELKQQLAEKEKEIDNLYDKLNNKQKFYEMSLEKDYKEYLSRLDKLEKQYDKDKISFAVEQLEQTRKLVDKLLDNCKNKQYKVWEVFDNQIKQLKGVK